MNKKKKIKLLYAEIIIITVILPAILLPQIIGSTTVSVVDGVLVSIDSIGELTAAIADDDDVSRMATELFPGGEAAYYASFDSAVNAVSEGEAGYIIVTSEQVPGIIEEYAHLMVYPEVLRIDEADENAAEYYAIVRRSDYAYGTTNKTSEDLNKESIRVAVVTGGTEGEYFLSKYPSAIIDYYDEDSEAILALKSGQADYIVQYNLNLDSVLQAYPEFAKMYEPLKKCLNCFGAPKTERGRQLTAEFDKFIDEIKQDGRYQALYDKWNSDDESSYYLDYNLTGENGEIYAVTGGTWPPNTFLYNGRIMGFFVEQMYMFCEKYGYSLKLEVATYAAELAGITTGKYDFMLDVIEYTEERTEQIYFTSPAIIEYSMLYTMADSAHTETVSRLSQFISSIKDGFTKNYVTNSRYVTILNGLLTTVMLAALTMLFGTMLGIIVCAMRMNQNPFVQGFARIYIKLLQGIPIVVTLLILFYVVLAGTNVSGFWVCIIGFSLDFSAYTSEIFRSGIEAVPEGQLRAATALGFSKRRGFIKVVLPQALKHILPVYSGQFIAMVKTTCVAGYIAVQDLTKASDLIRAVTFDAFFPIIGSAAVYFLISALLVLMLRLIESKTDISKRRRLPKGVTANAD